MRNKIGTTLIILGVILVLSATALFARNKYEENKAADSASGVLNQLQEVILKDEKPDETLTVTEPMDTSMPTVTVDGYHYIGYLSIPNLALELPVMDSWDYSKLKIAPCHYYGSYKTDDLVIAGHNYKKHFGELKNLDVGSAVYFTDAEGNIHAYKVTAIEILLPSDTLQMVENEFDLSLYTCTYGGRERVTVRCVRQSSD